MWSNGSAQWHVPTEVRAIETATRSRSLGSVLSVLAMNRSRHDLHKSDKGAGFIKPYDAISDYWLYDSEQPSHVDGPEHEIVYVNEQVQHAAAQYNDLAIAGMKINASTEWSNFSNFSAYLTEGIQVRRLIDDQGNSLADTGALQSTNLFPEIAYDLLTDKDRGAGELIGISQVHRERMQLAAKFCRANEFYWDGAIEENQNLRELVYENASFCLLDFTILGGQFSLYPSVPHKATSRSIRGAAHRALFTDGNIKDLKVTFLSPEERAAFRATVLYRDEMRNGFSQTRVFSARLAGTSVGAPEETFDLAEFCTSKAQAEWFARMALQLRDKVDHSFQFQTTPQAAMGLEPGEYIRLVSEAIHTDRFENGSIDATGKISAASMPEDNASIMYWKPGTEGVRTATLSVKDGTAAQTELALCLP